MARAPHPYADLFPLMNEAALKELPASISKDGLQDPITIPEAADILKVSKASVDRAKK